MNDDELKKLWQQQSPGNPVVSPAQVMSAVQKQTTYLRICLLARDIQELVACGIIVIIFGVFYFTVYRNPISRVGDLIIIGSAIFVAWKLIHARRSTPPAPPGATIVESLRAELKSAQTQSRLLGSVLWWYLLPGFTGLVIATWGLRIDAAPKVLCTIFFVAVYAFVWWLNQRARRKQLVPLEAQLEALLHSAETGEPPDETRLANLRPIALAAAAGQVKAVEFKFRATSLAAFWHIALWGEIGFIGIWFFMMIDLVTSNAGSAKGRAVPTPVQTIRVEETNSYSVVARKFVDLINAHDYAGMQQLYDDGMAEAFPPKRTSDLYSRIAAGFGHIETVDGPIGKGYQGWTAFRLHCQRGEMTMSLALDADDKIAGIYFKAAGKIIVWRRLIWIVPLIVPFSLAGLVYSWLLLRLVELLGVKRSRVGMSALGIHLDKGQTIVLWDEIKEVRLFGLLHVRCLSLTRESGEKTFMPWTDFERHSEVKAAVEGFAPAHHPIRKYLALLKRLKTNNPK